jgi:hypothetical protein
MVLSLFNKDDTPELNQTAKNILFTAFCLSAVHTIYSILSMVPDKVPLKNVIPHVLGILVGNTKKTVESMLPHKAIKSIKDVVVKRKIPYSKTGCCKSWFVSFIVSAATTVLLGLICFQKSPSGLVE